MLYLVTPEKSGSVAFFIILFEIELWPKINLNKSRVVTRGDRQADRKPTLEPRGAMVVPLLSHSVAALELPLVHWGAVEVLLWNVSKLLGIHPVATVEPTQSRHGGAKEPPRSRLETSMESPRYHHGAAADPQQNRHGGNEELPWSHHRVATKPVWSNCGAIMRSS